MVLEDVQALTFDVFGTVVDWHGTVVRLLKQFAAESQSEPVLRLSDEDWSDFAKEWRKGYMTKTKERAAGASGSLNVDIMHREILDEMLATRRWAELKTKWSEKDLQEINMAWHRLDGWPDSSSGLAQLKRKFIVSTLTNGNTRLMVDMAKHANLPWDLILTADLLGSFKPNPIVYQEAARHLSVKLEQCAMVAAHIYDLRAAAREGMRTVYIRRPTEDSREDRESVKSKKEGGEVDLIANSFEELAEMLGCNKV